MRKRRTIEFPTKTVLPEVPLEPLDDLPCPVCGQVMRVVRRGAIPVDVCAGHGVWLDAGELDRLLEAARARARDSTLARTGALAREAAWGGRLGLAQLADLLARERRRVARAARQSARR